jgi:hypothetical protein
MGYQSQNDENENESADEEAYEGNFDEDDSSAGDTSSESNTQE